MLNKTLNISETFLSIQGESSYTGFLCFFIRLNGCNLNCSYCDTKYANSIENSTIKTISEIIDEAISLNPPLVEITGGEPLCQQNTVFLCESLIENGFKVLLETNGSISIKNIPKNVIKILDCKTPSSGENSKNLYDNFNFLNQNDEVKFVISDFADYIYAIKIIDEFELYDKVKNILLSPIQTKIKAKQLAKWMMQDKVNARLQVQLHKVIDVP